MTHSPGSSTVARRSSAIWNSTRPGTPRTSWRDRQRIECAHGQSADRAQKHNDSRELVIGQSARGYTSLYRHLIALDTVFVLAIRAQRDAGDARDA
ncbi:hypothetical protein [Xanthomonas medicagonis]|uniref:hypothetical protein n=1 Tax=Xanthomonas medicagonis TaxID=3160841 RepID=UPI0035116471